MHGSLPSVGSCHGGSISRSDGLLLCCLADSPVLEITALQEAWNQKKKKKKVCVGWEICVTNKADPSHLKLVQEEGSRPRSSSWEHLQSAVSLLGI